MVNLFGPKRRELTVTEPLEQLARERGASKRGPWVQGIAFALGSLLKVAPSQTRRPFESKARHMLTRDEYLQILEVYRDKNLFSLGTLERRVTVYSQQVRALNLIYALIDSERLKAGDKVAIVGGGFSGVTAAAAAALVGCNVTLYERKPTLLHLQSQNDTRWLHPRIYDWPDEDATELTTDLPFLRWRSARAGDVAEEVRNSFQRIQLRVGARLLVKTRVGDLDIADAGSGGLSISHNGAPEAARAIILAVGFGLEKTYGEVAPLSYWRNDGHAQTVLTSGSPASYLISGTGDGGLIDLLRIRIDRFRQDRIVDELFPVDSRDIEQLLDALRIARKRAFGLDGSPATDPTFLSNEYNGMRGLRGFSEVSKRVQDRLRTDTTARLHGAQPFFVTSTTSILHSFLTFVLQELGAFDFDKRELTAIRHEGKVWRADFLTKGGSTKTLTFDHVIVRHGAALPEDDSDVRRLVMEHQEKLKVLDAKDYTRNYRQDMTALRLHGNTNEWWVERGAPPLDEKRSVVTSESSPPRSQDAGHSIVEPFVLRSIPGSTLPIYCALHVRPDWFTELGQSNMPESLDSSMLYFGPGFAHCWRKMTGSSPVYQYLERFFGPDKIGPILNQHFAKSVNIVDLGIGNSSKAHNIVHFYVADPAVEKVNYVALDISHDMLELTLGKLHEAQAPLIGDVRQKNGAIIGINSAFSNIQLFRMLLEQAQRSLFLILGNTLGNERSDVATLEKVRTAMRAEDLLLVELQLLETVPVTASQMTEMFNAKDEHGVRRAYDFYTGVHRTLHCPDPTLEVVDRRVEHLMGGREFGVTCRLPKPQRAWHPALATGQINVPQVVEVYRIRKYSLELIASTFEEAGFEIIHGGDAASTYEDPVTRRRFVFVFARMRQR